MCGRYALKLQLAEICALFDATTALGDFTPHYNMGLGMDLPIIIKGRLGLARWEWPTPVPGVKPLINIRSETAASKPSFARSWHEGRHALVPASGFYEWDASGQPYWVSSPDHPIMAFKALWTREADNTPCFAILTESALPVLAPIHSRMPQMVTPDGQVINTPTPVAIGRAVNDIAKNDPSLLLPTNDATQGHLWVA